ncbi:hypothetical protein CO174_05090 [Candidatus Uhrbacteria bacterium CG_4_9_14_3_um_filter_50_9]|uniref:Uncharacterized protein n=1 Tax=Candidatus Uhrbacteria bacterium CG_4_9_14_3_um_filter_50_9 TaxID=1975035 RepID=A0A2M7XB11_9BACT|nr:MAG: hypothetical protein CO174_05090 [Candidatus Uhrbacteria bacterium CG_4_9_14_3_um_filter_50_9]
MIDKYGVIPLESLYRASKEGLVRFLPNTPPQTSLIFGAEVSQLQQQPTTQSQPTRQDPPLPTFTTDQSLTRLSVDEVGRTALLHYNGDPKATKEERVHTWQAVEGGKRLAIGRAVLALNKARINWRSFGSLMAMLEAAKAL